MSKMPSIDFIFKQLSTSLVERSERGTAFLIVRDNTDDSFKYVKYTSLADVEAEKFDADNVKYINAALSYTPYEVLVVRIATEGKLTDALNTIKSLRLTGWIAVAGGSEDDSTALASWIKATDERGYTYKAVVCGLDNIDDKHIVNLYNHTGMIVGGEEIIASDYVPYILSLVASNNIKSSITYKICKSVEECDLLDDDVLKTAISKGMLCITKVDDEYVIAVGINSLVTLDNSLNTEDMQYIETIEIIDMVQDDIKQAFKEYIGNVRNTYANQMLFCSACNGYFRELESEANYVVLDPDYNNNADINVEKQKSILMVNKPEVENWTDAQIKHYPYKRTMYLKGEIKTTFCVDSLVFECELAN